MGRIEKMLVQYMATDTQKMLVEHDTIFKNHQDNITDLQRQVEEISRRLDEEDEMERLRSLEYVEHSDEEIIQVTETKMDVEVPPPVSHAIIDFWSDSDDEINEEESVQLEEQPTPGYKYDAEGNYLGYMNRLGELFPTFSEEGKEPIMEYVDEEEELIPDTETRVADEIPPQVSQDEIELGESFELMFGVEDMVKVDNELNEEDEFLNMELDGLLDYDEGNTLDVSEDVAFFEALLIEDNVDKDVVLEEEHHYRPVDCVLNADQELKPRDKVEDDRLPENRSCVYFRRWSTGMKKLIVKHDQSSQYLQHIRLLPVELNGFDRVQIKEKPPD
ncbi:uncharacterized protein LOC143630991 [Bidens hawaiensis]|uniref:uncharacterized protein LOC143630991 n=1 Tax=Bidens hawaiensis TaxID=980011 RepID=UPI00404A85FA